MGADIRSGTQWRPGSGPAAIASASLSFRLTRFPGKQAAVRASQPLKQGDPGKVAAKLRRDGGQISNRASEQEATVLLERLAVHFDSPAPSQVADEIGMNSALVAAAALGIARAHGHVHGAADLLVQQDIAGAPIDPVVGPDAELAETARPGVGVEEADQVLLAALGARIHHLSPLEPQLHARDLATA